MCWGHKNSTEQVHGNTPLTRSLRDWQIFVLILKHLHHIHNYLSPFPLLSSHRSLPSLYFLVTHLLPFPFSPVTYSLPFPCSPVSHFLLLPSSHPLTPFSLLPLRLYLVPGQTPPCAWQRSSTFTSSSSAESAAPGVAPIIIAFNIRRVGRHVHQVPAMGAAKCHNQTCIVFRAWVKWRAPGCRYFSSDYGIVPVAAMPVERVLALWQWQTEVILVASLVIRRWLFSAVSHQSAIYLST
jgi:hypothetical protein